MSITAKEFIEKYKVNPSTVYYLLTNKVIKTKYKKTKYGQRKCFNEEDMLKECKARLIIPPTEEEYQLMIEEARAKAAASKQASELQETDNQPVVIETPEIEVSEEESTNDKIEISITIDPTELEET